MLTIQIPDQEFYDEETECFIDIPGLSVDLEHSLVSVSKWEAKFGKPFLTSGQKTDEEVLEYVSMMCVTKGVTKDDLIGLTNANYKSINEYISSDQSATTFTEPKGHRGRGGGEIITSELIYFWMVAQSIPFECENWHLNRLFALLRICNIKNGKDKKMSKSETAARNRALNEQRKAQLGTRG